MPRLREHPVSRYGLVIPNRNLSIKEGVISVWESDIAEWEQRLYSYCRAQASL